MSRITFLNNASQGENNWWRYLITIILTWGTPIVLEIVILVIAMVYLVSLGIASSNSFGAIISNPLVSLVLIGVTTLVSVLFLYIGVRFIHKREFISLINTDSRFSWKNLLKGFGIWFSLLMVGIIISLIIDPSGLKVTFKPSTFGLLLIISLLVFPIQASFEELFFRGYLMQGLGVLSKKPVVPLLITSIVFAVLHAFNSTNPTVIEDIVLQTFIIGLTLGIITLGENRLETAMGVHIANNIFVSVIANTSEGGFGDLPSLYTNTSLPDPLLDVLGIGMYALVLLVIIFWGKKENVFRIFRPGKPSDR